MNLESIWRVYGTKVSIWVVSSNYTYKILGLRLCLNKVNSDPSYKTTSQKVTPYLCM